MILIGIQKEPALVNAAISTLPFVLLKTHVYMTAKQVDARAITARLNTVSSFQGVKNRGRCQSAQRGPRIRIPRRGPYSDCSRGSANPRQPGSSPSAPPRKSTYKKTPSKDNGASAPSPSNDPSTPGMKTTLSTAITGMPMKVKRSYLKPTRHSTNRRRKRPTPALPSIAPVMMNAARNGPIKIQAGAVHTRIGLLHASSPEPSAESTWGSSLSHVPAKASTKKEKTNGCRASRA